MRTPVLILPVKGQILRTLGEGCKKWQNFADVLWERSHMTSAAEKGTEEGYRNADKGEGV